MFFEPAQQGGTDTELDSVASPAAQGHLELTTESLSAAGRMDELPNGRHGAHGVG